MSKVMSINAGSSSLKFQLFEMPEEKVLISGNVERIGFDDAYFTTKLNGEKKKEVLPIKNHGEAVSKLLKALVEMKHIAIAMGAKEETLNGLTGVGDLVVTCTSKLSRNYQAGYLIGSGDNLEEALSKMTMVVEGARTCISAYQVSKKLNVYTPIIDGVYDVIYNHEKPEDVVFRLMSKTLKPERY